jgi:hypothetical protein
MKRLMSLLYNTQSATKKPRFCFKTAVKLSGNGIAQQPLMNFLLFLRDKTTFRADADLSGF